MDIVGLVILAVVALGLALFGGKRQYRKRSKTPHPFSQRPSKPVLVSATRPADAVDQLRNVIGAPFQKRRLMSRGEYEVFRTIERHLPNCGPGFRIMAQPSMGEFLASPDTGAFLSINSKRVDMLVIDTFGMPVVAIEHQGNGHYQDDAAARDAVKREALRRAGVELVEIFDYHSPADICRLTGEAIARNKPPASPDAIPTRPAAGQT
ncbi:DUF2726 domain-containing protein [Devosia soli]|uniref:DUF2726 domain-containing protein n=1 Tax=Devosia soli TaxID=361041 RepID=UPI00069A2A81|nr:DUF2726 domain-containing protein [Devosia soli]